MPARCLSATALVALTGLALPALAQDAASESLEPEIVTLDLDGDSRPESVLVFRNADGEIVRAEADASGDGLADAWVTFGVDDQGRQTAELAIDRDHDGTPDEWRWSLGGVTTRIGRDTRGDGAADFWSILDPEGVVVGVHGDTNGDGNVDSWSEVAPGGLTTSTAYDTNGDGRADRWVRFLPDGSIDRVETDTNGDGEPDRTVGSS